MEEFTVLKKGTEEIYYVLSLAATHDEVVILANIESGGIVLTTLNDLSTNYDFNGKEEEQDDEEDDDEEEVESSSSTPAFTTQN